MEPSPRPVRNPSMTDSDDKAAKTESRDSICSPIPVIMMLGGGFATLVLVKAGWDLLLRYGGL